MTKDWIFYLACIIAVAIVLNSPGFLTLLGAALIIVAGFLYTQLHNAFKQTDADIKALAKQFDNTDTTP